MLNEIRIGKVRGVYKGEWNAETTYELLDTVYYNGSSYQALVDYIPPNTNPEVKGQYWGLQALKGADGASNLEDTIHLKFTLEDCNLVLNYSKNLNGEYFIYDDGELIINF